MDDLTKLEINLEKLSSLFFSSLEQVRKYSPLIPNKNEESMDNSKMNLDRINFEQIENYEEGKQNCEIKIKENSNSINDTFQSIFTVLEDLKTQEDFQKTDEELKRNLKDLKEWNELKIKSISDKMKYMEDLVGNIKKEGASLINENTNN